MTHEKIFTRKDGTRVKVSVWLYVHQNQSNWGYLIFVQEPSSDQWIDPFSNKAYLLRAAESKRFNGHATFDHFVSKNEILQAKMELWKMIKPV
ncbi:hypothetical protein DYBT9275_02151 [Dyadobacter sp. CECT 9275]|uniref:Uncharacterized protein n=1 Tax=Dyadobacter helix TaxID=2822344 RepID=A0A916JCK6_9BACT|nr:hypothetical protein [Dyadobacter sp. CECT 9275]CAG4999092.1 hypothetical protein DYBT9275_02151 [Dyadobacter sp. CECT 9275]